MCHRSRLCSPLVVAIFSWISPVFSRLEPFPQFLESFSLGFWSCYESRLKCRCYCLVQLPSHSAPPLFSRDSSPLFGVTRSKSPPSNLGFVSYGPYLFRIMVIVGLSLLCSG